MSEAASEAKSINPDFQFAMAEETSCSPLTSIRWDRRRENLCSEDSTGGKRVYIRYCREAKKLIPDKHCDWWDVVNPSFKE